MSRVNTLSSDCGVKSFVPECGQRIDPGGATGGKVAGEEGDDEHARESNGEGEWIVGVHAKQLALHQTGRSESKDQAQRETG